MWQFVTDVSLVHNDQLALLQFLDDRGKFTLVELLRKQRIDRILQSPYLSWSGLTPPTEILNDGRDLFVVTRRDRYAKYGYFREVVLSSNLYVPAFEMLDQGIKTFVLADDMKLRIRVFSRQFTNVIGDMEIQRILAVAGYLDVLGVVTKKLHGICKVKRYLCLVRTDKDEYLEWVPGQELKVLGMNVFEIDEYVVRCHGSLRMDMGQRIVYPLRALKRSYSTPIWHKLDVT